MWSQLSDLRSVYTGNTVSLHTVNLYDSCRTVKHTQWQNQVLVCVDDRESISLHWERRNEQVDIWVSNPSHTLIVRRKRNAWWSCSRDHPLRKQINQQLLLRPNTVKDDTWDTPMTNQILLWLSLNGYLISFISTVTVTFPPHTRTLVSYIYSGFFDPKQHLVRIESFVTL